MLDRGGYVPGENVMMSAKVVNQSPMKIKGTRVCLTETIEYFMHKKKARVERRDLVVIKRGKIRPFTMDEMSEKIYIPPLPPTNLQGCHLINISYDVFVSATWRLSSFVHRRLLSFASLSVHNWAQIEHGKTD